MYDFSEFFLKFLKHFRLLEFLLVHPQLLVFLLLHPQLLVFLLMHPQLVSRVESKHDSLSKDEARDEISPNMQFFLKSEPEEKIFPNFEGEKSENFRKF